MIAPLLAGGIALLVSLLGTWWLTAFLAARGRSQPILVKDDINIAVPAHTHKAGTPTMGGLAIVGAAGVGYVVSHVREGVVFSDQTLIMWAGVLVMGGIGLLDDVIKVRTKHNRGVLWKKKGWITLALAGGLSTLLVMATSIDTRLSLTRADLPGLELGKVVFIIWAALLIFSTTNAVNVTDGLDGLAGGSAMIGFAAFTMISYLEFRNPVLYPDVVNPYDTVVFAASFAGACGGFLWFNSAPATIFMGDVGALAIGAALAQLALATNTHLLLALICGINVIEIGSVALQMLVFRASGRKRRVFRLSPLHHHFELVGWAETKVIIRFWLISGACVMTALAIFFADFTHLATS